MIEKYLNFSPEIHTSAFVHHRAQVIGKVRLEENASVWPFAALRGDIEEIVIGKDSNVQDNAVLHTSEKLPVIIGQQVTIGHSVVLHGCKIGNRCIIGIGAIVLDGAIVEEDCIVGAGAVVAPGTVVKRGHMALGLPARSIRTLRQDELDRIVWNAAEYLKLKKNYILG